MGNLRTVVDNVRIPIFAKLVKNVSILSLAFVLSGCNEHSDDEYNKLATKIERISKELAETKAELIKLRQTPENIFRHASDSLAAYKKFHIRSDLIEAKEGFSSVIARHPDSKSRKDSKRLLEEANKLLGAHDKKSAASKQIEDAIAAGDFQKSYAALNRSGHVFSKEEKAEWKDRIKTEKNKPISIGIGELINEFEQNQLRAKKKYRRKRVLIAGELRQIGDSFSDDMMIVRQQGREAFAYFRKSQRKKVMMLQKGDHLYLDCRPSNLAASYIVMIDCLITTP